MTRTILQFTLQGRPFGAWENDVSSVVRGRPLHHLPLSPSCVAGMTIIEDRGTTVIDTGVCLGLLPQDSETGASFLLVGGDGKRTGYRVEGSVDTVACDESDILPLPVMVRTELLRSCVVRGDAVIPVVELGRLQERIAKGIIDVPGPGDSLAAPPREDQTENILRVLSLGDDRFCISGTGAVLVAAGLERIREIPAARGRSTGVLHHNGAVIPLLPVCEHLGLAESFPVRGVVVVEHKGGSYGIAVTEDHGLLEGAAFTVKPLPPIARSGCITDAVVVNGEVVPRIDLAGIIGAGSGKGEEQPLADRYRPDASFPSIFRKEAVGVTEVALFGGKHGMPRDEVREIISYATPRKVPLAPAIVLGVAERDGNILPVLDLAAIFGKRSPVDPQWKLVRVQNGDFSALVAVEQVLGEKQLTPDVQRKVPIVLPYDVLYGCYLDDAAVRLIVNVQSLAVHFEKTTIRQLMATMSPETMETVPVTMEDKRTAVAAATAGGGDAESSAGPGPETHPSPEDQPIEPGPKVYASGFRTMPKADGTRSGRPDTLARAESHAAPASGGADQQLIEKETEQEKARTQAGEELLSAEKTRLKAEEEKKAAETAGIRAEQERREAEESRMAREKERQEQARAREEHKRVQEETVRKERAEKERAAAQADAEQRELERLLAEKNRKIEEERKRYQDEQDARARDRMEIDQAQARTSTREPHRATERPAAAVEGPEASAYSGIRSTMQAPDRPHTARNLLLAAVAAAVLLLLVFGSRPEKKDPASVSEPVHDRMARADRTEQPEKKNAIQKEQEPPLVLAVPKAMPVPEQSVYVVVKGDTLWGIAKRFTGNPLNYPRVAKDNSIATPDLIFPGQRIRLKNE